LRASEKILAMQGPLHYEEESRGCEVDDDDDEV